MAEWVRLCGANDAPKPGEVTEVDASGQQFCIANIGGHLHALENLCPHRQGPLGQGWVEGNAVVCPWHAWAFDVESGACEEPERAQVRVFPTRTDKDGVYADLA